MSEQSRPGVSTWDSGCQAEHTRSAEVAVVAAEDLGESGHPEPHCHRVLQGAEVTESVACAPVWELRPVRGRGHLCPGSSRCGDLGGTKGREWQGRAAGAWQRL